MRLDRHKLFARIKADAEAGFDGNEGAVGGAISDYERRKDAVFAAARQADHRYDGAAPDSQGMTRAEYVGRAVLAVLYED